jgi:hypothetical protein
MNIQSLTDVEKAELNTRLLSINIVSWQWNEKGLKIHKAEGRTEKLKNTPEMGVLAQDVRDKLQDLFPHIILIHKTGALMVNYELIAELAKQILEHLDKLYRHSDPKGKKLQLKALIKKYQTDDIQLYATRLLALVKLYNQEIKEILK